MYLLMLNLDVRMSEYLAHAFYRHTVVQCHDSEAVAEAVEQNIGSKQMKG